MQWIKTVITNNRVYEQITLCINSWRVGYLLEKAILPWQKNIQLQECKFFVNFGENSNFSCQLITVIGYEVSKWDWFNSISLKIYNA